MVITDGSIQGYKQLYFWAAEGLAQAGYMVMTYDVQGQGESDLLPTGCVASCLTRQALHRGALPAELQLLPGGRGLAELLPLHPAAPYGGSSNPDAGNLNHQNIALAGHSLGAAAVSEVGQCDRRVTTIVAWDDLSAITNCNGVIIPPADRSTTLLHASALALTNDYFLNPEPMTSVPNHHAKDAGYRQLATAGLNTEEVAIRGTTHLTYTYIPYVLPAGSLSERVAFYYTRPGSTTPALAAQRLRRAGSHPLRRQRRSGLHRGRHLQSGQGAGRPDQRGGRQCALRRCRTPDR